MKKIPLALALGMTLMSLTPSLCAKETKAVKAPTLILDLEYQRTNFDYREFDSVGQILDSEKADDLNGFGIAVKAKVFNGLMGGNASYLRVGYEHSSGDTEYVGALLSGGSYGSYIGTTDNTINEYSLIYTEEYLSEQYDLWSGLGGGYREWERELSADQLETYKWFYWNIEVGTRFHYNKNLSLGLVYNYKRAINPEMDTDFTGLPDMTFDLGGVKGYTFAMPLIYSVDKDSTVYLEYKREYFEIAKSNIVNGFYEPDSTTENDKITVGIRFKFGE